MTYQVPSRHENSEQFASFDGLLLDEIVQQLYHKDALKLWRRDLPPALLQLPPLSICARDQALLRLQKPASSFVHLIRMTDNRDHHVPMSV